MNGSSNFYVAGAAAHARVEFIRGRLKYELGGEAFPSMIAYYGEEPNIAEYRRER